ncbi:hypothetical protein D3C75_967990 [compost metagenome]
MDNAVDDGPFAEGNSRGVDFHIPDIAVGQFMLHMQHDALLLDDVPRQGCRFLEAGAVQSRYLHGFKILEGIAVERQCRIVHR